MATIVSGNVGYVAPLPNGASQTGLGQGRNGEGIVTELHGKYYESNRRGSVWTATQGVAGVLATLTSATVVSSALVCPPGSAKALSLIRVEVAIKTIPTTPVVGYYILGVAPAISMTKVTGTALVANGGMVGNGATPTGIAMTTATIPAACNNGRLIAQKTAATAPAATVPYTPTMFLDLDGTCIIQPGTYVSVGQDAADATNATIIVTYIWEEVDL